MTQIFGHMRFSFFGRNDTRLSRHTADEEKRFALLYAPRRMEERFYFFEHITLPSIRAQTDPDFKLLVVSSKIMPDPYKDRLQAAVADIPQIEVIYSEAAHITDELNPRIADLTAGEKGNTVQFRLDDDDAICARMVALLREAKHRARKDELVSFPRGLFLTMEAGEPRLMRKFEPYIAIGWAYVNKPGQIRNPYQGMHNAAHHYVPSMLDPRPLAYIHVSHESSDTRFRKGMKLEKAKAFDPDFAAEREKIDAQVRVAFPGFTAASLEAIIANAPGAKAKAAAPRQKTGSAT